MRDEFILWFDQINIADIPIVGGKNASLGEMYQNLTKQGVNVPGGFTVTAYAYQYFLEHAGIKQQIKQDLAKLNPHNMKQLNQKGKAVRKTILKAKFPAELRKAIVKAYEKHCTRYGKDADVAVRSSATAEDLPDASFAGQQETYLNVRGKKELLKACKKCFASLFTNRAIAYRHEKGFDHFKVLLSIGVQKMVRSDKASSGVIFTLDTESGFRDVVFVTAAYGLGENVVQGAVNPDEYYVFKPTLRLGFKPVISKTVGSKKIKMIYSSEKGSTTKNINVRRDLRKRFALQEHEILKLAEWAVKIEQHYSKKAGHPRPMDIEWAKDGRTGHLYIVQARPETVHSQKNLLKLEEYRLGKKGSVLVEGHSVGSKIATGKVEIIRNVHDITKFKRGAVLVTEMTDPDWVPVMKMASAIVTNRGGRTCHAAIVSRELGIPCVVGTIDGTSKIKNNQFVTVDCSQGDIGYVYKGKMPFKVKKTSLETLKRPRTKIMMNIGTPEEAFEKSFIPNDGVGLARQEFIINSYIKIHPLALINYDKLTDPKLKAKIATMTHGYKDKKQFFIEKLSEGVARIAAAFYPKDVIVRLSDFKSNEYANLIGGKDYEPLEDNPMIGWRGASRYYSLTYKPAFALECKALKRVREEMGLTNVKLMVPFCRTVNEGKKVISEMRRNGLVQGKNDLEVYVMCEVPSNVLLADQFSQVFDGFSIGTNDLTQLCLGLDRDSELVSDLYDERNEAVKRLVSHVIAIARKKHRKIGICGDAPSTYPEFAQFLVESGIDSISLTPDAVLKTTVGIIEKEKSVGYRH